MSTIDLANYSKIKKFEGGRGAEEHAVLSSLGRRKSSKSTSFQNCNIELGIRRMNR